MATLKQLSLSGIRNFKPQENFKSEQKIEFSSPLTLILGENGCGKTTILESIKYACTEKLPKSCIKNQNFLFNSQLCSGSAKGRINLKITDPKSGEVSVYRVLEQDIKNHISSRSSIFIRNEKQSENRSEVSDKCCRILNIPPAVLNSVIFCHQEKSFWMFENAQVVKYNFDKMFATKKHNDCIQSLKEYQKKLMEETKIDILKVQLKGAFHKKEKVEKQEVKLKEKKNELNRMEREIEFVGEKIEKISQQVDDIGEIQDALGKLTTKKKELEVVSNEVLSVRNNLEVFLGSDDELRNEIEAIKNTQSDGELTEIEEKCSEIDQECMNCKHYIFLCETELKELHIQKKNFEEKSSRQMKLLEQMKKDMNISNSEKMSLKDITTFVNLKKTELEKTVSEKETTLKKVLESLDEVEEKRIRAKETMEFKKQQIQIYGQQILQIKNDLSDMSDRNDDLKKCRECIESASSELAALGTISDEKEDEIIASLRQQVAVMKNRVKALEQIKSETKMIEENMKKFDNKKEKHSESLKYLFAGSVPRDFTNAILKKRQEAKKLYQHLTDQITEKQREVTTLGVQLNHQTKEVTACEQELERNREKISQICKGKDFNETLETTFTNKKRLEQEKSRINSMKVVFEDFIKNIIEGSPQCPVCETDFSVAAGIIEQIVTSLEKRVTEASLDLKKIENELQQEETLYGKLQELKYFNVENELLKMEKLPQLKQNLEETKESFNKKLLELNKLKHELTKTSKTIEITGHIISDMSPFSVISASKKNLEILKINLLQTGYCNFERIDDEIRHLTANVKDLSEKITTRIRLITTHKESVKHLKERKILLEKNQKHLQQDIQNKKVLEAKVSDLSLKKSTLDKEVSDLRGDLFDLESAIKNITEKKDSMIGMTEDQVVQEREKLDKCKKMVEEIEQLQDEIEEYSSNNLDEKIKSAEEELQNVREEEQMLQLSKTHINEEIKKKKAELIESKSKFQTLQNNLVLRLKNYRKVELEQEIAALMEKIGFFDYSKAFDKKRELMQQMNALKKDMREMIDNKNEIMQTIRETEQDLTSPKYANAISDYNSKYYELKIAENVSEDLLKYVSALESAVFELHTHQLKQINKTLRELWQKIYRGNDIDYIKIKSEFTSNDVKRTYNYTVVQVKRGVEMDMKSCCSAGQKYLASVIIRMAIAESLGSSGILALDEPTTHLDEEHVKILCETISDIIRAKEDNFQLVIITHNEEFLNKLSRVHDCCHYYRIRRDINGFSVIEKQSL